MKEYVNFKKGLTLTECEEIALDNNVRFDIAYGYEGKVVSDFCDYRVLKHYYSFKDFTFKTTQNLELKKAHLLAGTDDCYTLILREKTKPFEIKVGMTAKEIQDNFKSLKEQKIIINYVDNYSLLYSSDYALFDDNRILDSFYSLNLDKKVIKIRGKNNADDIVLDVE